MSQDSSHAPADQRDVGRRAEFVAGWYLRLNGFMAIPGFVVHLDQRKPRRSTDGSPIIQRTEADFVAVRFPFSREKVDSREMQDDRRIVVDEGSGRRKVLFVLAEVKAGACNMNGPWTDRRAKNMQRVLRRMGFTAKESNIDSAAEDLYDAGRWEGDNVIVQYVCFGDRTVRELKEQHCRLVQLTWKDVADFLTKRHAQYPEKTPGGLVHKQWPTFGRCFGEWFVSSGRRATEEAAAQFIRDYIHGRLGRCNET